MYRPASALPFDNLLKIKAWWRCGTSGKLVAEPLFYSRGVRAALLFTSHLPPILGTIAAFIMNNHSILL